MFFCHLLLLLTTVLLQADAKLNPRALHLNASSISSTSSATVPTASASVLHLQPAETPSADKVCCFVVQDVVSEEWWEIVTTSSVYKVVNWTQITAHVTPYPTTTITNYESHVQTTNTSFPFTIGLGSNPIPLLGNAAPHPAEIAQSINGTALITGGVPVQSPAAFYVYSTVKVITAAAITDKSGNLACGTTSGGFPNMNQNAQAYFGGPPATPVVISLTTPFIYQPARGQTGAVYGVDTCFETPPAGTEDYGYVPQTLLDFLIDNKEYSSQYPGLSACLPGGPSIIPSGCGTVSYFTTTFTSTPPPSVVTITSTSLVFFNQTTTRAASTFKSTTTIVITSIFSSIIPPSTITPSNSVVTAGNLTRTFTVTGGTLPASTSVITEVLSTTATAEETAAATTGVILESSAVPVTLLATNTFEDFIVQSIGSVTIFPVASTFQPPSYVTPAGTDITEITVSTGTPLAQQLIQSPGDQSPGVQSLGAQTPPAQSPPNQTPPSQQPAAKASPASPATPNPIASAICQIIGSCPTAPPAGTPVQGEKTTPAVNVIIQPTTMPLAAAPSGLQGQTSTIDGTPVLIITSPVTFTPGSSPTPDAVRGGSVTFINGSPFVVISSSTLIPFVNAPSQLTNAPITIINNTPFLEVGPTTFLAAPTPQPNGPTLSTTNIGGTNFIVFPSATDVPLSNALPGLTGSLTIINNTPFIAVPGATSIPVQANPTGSLSTTTINGTPFVVVPNPTQIPLSNAPPGLVGQTTTIGGTAFLIIPSATNFQLPTSPPNIQGAITTVINNTPFLIFPSATTLPLSLGAGIPGGITTQISGSQVVIIPNPTTIVEPGAQITSIPGIVTVIGGVTEVIITGPATIPVNSAFTLSGFTTVISGVTEVILSTPTTISLPTSPSTSSLLSSTSSSSQSSSSSSSSTSSRSSRTSSSISSTSSSQTSTATPTAIPESNSKKGLSTGAKVGIAFGLVLFVLLMIALIWWLLKRRRDREEYAHVQPDAVPALSPSGETAATRQVGAASYIPVVRGGYAPAPEDDPYRPPDGAMSAARQDVASSSAPAVRRGYAPAPQEDPYRSLLRRPVGSE